MKHLKQIPENFLLEYQLNAHKYQKDIYPFYPALPSKNINPGIYWIRQLCVFLSRKDKLKK